MSRTQRAGVLMAQTVALVCAGFLLAGRTLSAPIATVSGTVLLQGRTSHFGTAILYGGTTVATTNAGGQFSFDVPDGPLQVVLALHTAHLSRRYVSAGPSLPPTLPETTLLIGDGTGDDRVNLADLVLVGANYGTTPPADPRADLNADGRVSLPDLVGVGLNYNKAGPLDWEPAPTTVRELPAGLPPDFPFHLLPDSVRQAIEQTE